MKHFHGIDGLRAWLAWTVVFAHIVMLTAADVKWPVLHKLSLAADHAVSVFIIISGFVITHLILEKKEKYIPYITRRFLRIYPLYFICLFIGILATWLHIEAFTSHPWGELTPQPEFLALQIAVFQGHGFWEHFIAHLTLLHGLLPNNILNQSEFMLLGPAWSLSLEWQFYLLAPLILFLLRYPLGKIAVPLVTIIGYYGYTEGWFGDFETPSCLPGAGLFFGVGICTRLIIRQLPRLASYPLAAVILSLGFIKMSHLMVPYIVWCAFIVWMLQATSKDFISIKIKKLLDLAFDSKVAAYLGERSYSTYLIHYPLIHIISYVCVKNFDMGLQKTVMVELVCAPLLTLFTSIVLFRIIEAPAIAYGKRLFKEAS
jgi:peptidoglycan/LPS O-acetylase OafA/YrhL